MDGNRRDSGCCPFFCARCNPQLVRRKAGFRGRVTSKYNLSGGRRVLTDERHQNATCPEKGGFSRTSHIETQLVRRKAGSHGRVTSRYNLSGRRLVFTDESHRSTTCPVEGGFSRTKLPSRPASPRLSEKSSRD